MLELTPGKLIHGLWTPKSRYSSIGLGGCQE